MANTLDEKTARQLIDSWSEAEVQGNTAVLRDLLHEDYIGIGPRGFTLTKQQWVGRFESGDLKNEALNFTIEKVRSYGDTALITGQHNQKTLYKGNPVPGEFRSTMVFVNQDSRWKLVSLQLSPIMAAPPMPPQQGN